MKTLMISVRTDDEIFDDFVEAWESGHADPVYRYSFGSWELLHKMLTPKRVAIIQAMTGAGPLSIREVARRVDRDFKGVHTDVTALAGGGLINRTADGGVVFPYDGLRMEVDLPSASAPSPA